MKILLLLKSPVLVAICRYLFLHYTNHPESIWRNFKNNKEQALEAYKNALQLGYTKPIPEMYKSAGIQFDFSKEYVKELMTFLETELD